jgi:hypothetical protein
MAADSNKAVSDLQWMGSMLLSGFGESVWLEKAARFGKPVQSRFWNGAQRSGRADSPAMNNQAPLNHKETG